MPKPRSLTDDQEAAALALHRSGLSIADVAKTYGLSWTGMRNCLDRAQARQGGPIKDSRETVKPGGTD